MAKESYLVASMRWLLNEQYNKVAKLREENQTLKDNVEFLHSCLDDRDKSIELMKEELDKIKKRVKEHTTYSVKAEFIKKFWE